MLKKPQTLFFPAFSSVLDISTRFHLAVNVPISLSPVSQIYVLDVSDFRVDEHFWEVLLEQEFSTKWIIHSLSLFTPTPPLLFSLQSAPKFRA